MKSFLDPLWKELPGLVAEERFEQRRKCILTDCEPDRAFWREGPVPLLAHRNRTGVWCGYVGVPSDSLVSEGIRERIELASHRGITFSGPVEGFPGGITVFWFGFDCGHLGDRHPWPPSELLISRSSYDDGEYRTYTYVKGILAALAAVVRPLWKSE